MKRLTMIPASIALLFCACQDTQTTGRPQVDISMMSDAADDAGLSDASRLPQDASVVNDDMMAGAAAEPAYVEAKLTPRRAIYTREDNPLIEFTVYDRIGRPIPEAQVRLDVQPAGQAEIGPDRRLRFLEQGPGAVRACATPDLCGRTSFFVDDAAPELVIESPARGEIVTGEPEIVVRGRTDADSSIRVFINDLPVDVAEDGSFETTLRADFGLNRVDVIADDGVRRPATRRVREVLWAPTRVNVAAGGTLDLSEIGILRISQLVIDRNESPEPPDANGIQRTFDLAGTAEALLGRADLLSLLDDPQLANDDDLSMRITDIENGQPDVVMLITENGFEIFVRLEDLSFGTSGISNFQGEPISLEGRVNLSVAGFAATTLEISDDGVPGLTLDDFSLAVEELSGTFDDSTAQAIVDTVGSILRRVLNGAANELMEDLVADAVPRFIELGLDDIIEPLRDIPLAFELEPPLPSISMTLSVGAERPRLLRRDRLELILNGRITPEMMVQAPHEHPGIPDFPIDAQPVWPPNQGVALALRLSVLNGVLATAWHQGIFRLDLSELVPDSFPQISELNMDARLTPVLVPAQVGSPNLLELQFGEIDVHVLNPLNPEPDRYVMSLRAGVNLSFEGTQVIGEVAESPDVRFELVAPGGQIPPLAPELFATLIQAQLGPAIDEAVEGLLSVELDALAVEADAFAPLNTDIESIQIQPSFPSAPRVQNGWLVIEATVASEIR